MNSFRIMVKLVSIAASPSARTSDGACTIAIIGGGAAGFFAAITAAEANPAASVTIFE